MLGIRTIQRRRAERRILTREMAKLAVEFIGEQQTYVYVFTSEQDVPYALACKIVDIWTAPSPEKLQWRLSSGAADELRRHFGDPQSTRVQGRAIKALRRGIALAVKRRQLVVAYNYASRLSVGAELPGHTILTAAQAADRDLVEYSK